MNSEQIRQYGRQIILPEIGAIGQKKILKSRILLVGAGGLGCAAAIYLTCAGIGKLGLIDGDLVQLSNLQRQILYSKSDVGKHKVSVARKKLSEFNNDTRFEIYPKKLTAGNFGKIAEGYDLILDGSDNFTTKFLVNDAALRHRKPAILAGIFKFSGQILTVLPGKSACFRCVFEEEPNDGLLPNCGEAGVLGSVVGTLGTMQATEAIKWVIGSPSLTINRFLLFDFWNLRFSGNQIRPKKNCLCNQTTKIEKKQN